MVPMVSKHTRTSGNSTTPTSSSAASIGGNLIETHRQIHYRRITVVLSDKANTPVVEFTRSPSNISLIHNTTPDTRIGIKFLIFS